MLRTAAPLLAAAFLSAASGPACAAARDLGSLALSDLDGDPVSLADLDGRVVVLNFWARWCEPCVAEMPVLARLAERYADRGLVVVAASVDEDAGPADLEAFADSLPDGMQVWLGATIDDLRNLGLGESLPVTLLLDLDGKLSRQHRGGLPEGSLDESIEELLPDREVPDDGPRSFPGAVEASCGSSPARSAAPSL